MSAGPPWLLGLQNELGHPIQGREGQGNMRPRGGCTAGSGRRQREPAFWDEVVEAGVGGIFDDTANGGGRRASRENGYAAAV